MTPARKNRNAIRHGLTATRLPKGASYIKQTLAVFRRAVEQETLERFARITAYRAALISSALRHETRAQLLQLWLRKASEPETQIETQSVKAGDTTMASSTRRAVGLGIMEKAQLLAQISAATDARDKCLASLGLGRDDHDNAIQALYRRIDQPADSEAGQAAPIASGATPEPAVSQ